LPAPDYRALPADVPTLRLSISSQDTAKLEAAPYADEFVPARFEDAHGKTYLDLQVHYRGAYALKNLMEGGAPQRNWKLKFSKANQYLNRREWNLNFEPSIKQELAYDLMRFAGVRAPTARHVQLVVNDEHMGLYLEYVDPDDGGFIKEQFGDATGDLYKAATDVPGEPRAFASLEVLGPADANYARHYSKKRNKDGTTDTDFSRLRAFLDALNGTPDPEFPAFIESNFDVEKLISYLVVWNYIGHWDGYPQRPKNFWLLDIPAAKRWVLLPWDLDATFELSGYHMNTMLASAPLFHQFDQFSAYDGWSEEGTERPLVRRTLSIPRYREAYVKRYREALTSFLARDALLERVEGLHALLADVANSSDLEALEESTAQVRGFIDERDAAIRAELAQEP
jgi:spore coat protein CotH